MDDPPYHSAPGDGAWSRQATDGWFSIWDLAKPVIAQVHGYAMAGATELASACDLVYVAEDAQISYPVVRVASPPDWQYHEPLLGMRHAMEALLTGDAVDGIEAARIGWANRAYPADRLADEVLAVAVRIAGVAADLTQIKKRLCTANSMCAADGLRSGRGRSSRPSPATRLRSRPSEPILSAP